MVLRSEQEIISRWDKKYDVPLVSVMCLTYNHENYIENALKGFLIQETDFPFEVLIHDDASTDHTADIIREYEKRYPHIIKPIYQKENQHSNCKHNIRKALYERIKGKYIARCEGDDYWVDPKKLQIQFDYLEEHPEVSVSGHDSVVIDENGLVIKKSNLADLYKRDYTGEELMTGKASLITSSMMTRVIPMLDIPEINMVGNGDTFLWSLLGNYGGSHHHIDIIPGAYRIHHAGVWSMKTQEQKREMSMLTWYWLYRYYQRIDKYKCADMYKQRYQNELLSVMSVKRMAKEVLARGLKLRNISKALRAISLKVKV